MLMLKKSYSKEDFERMNYLRKEEERIKKRFHFHFDQHLSVSQIQQDRLRIACKAV